MDDKKEGLNAFNQFLMIEDTLTQSNGLNLSKWRYIIVGIVLFIINIFFQQYGFACGGNQHTVLRYDIFEILSWLWFIFTYIGIYPGRIKYSSLNPMVKKIVQIYYVIFLCFYFIARIYPYDTMSMGLGLIFLGILFGIYGCLTNDAIMVIAVICVAIGLFLPTGFPLLPMILRIPMQYIATYFYPISFILVGIFLKKRVR